MCLNVPYQTCWIFPKIIIKSRSLFLSLAHFLKDPKMYKVIFIWKFDNTLSSKRQFYTSLYNAHHLIYELIYLIMRSIFPFIANIWYCKTILKAKLSANLPYLIAHYQNSKFGRAGGGRGTDTNNTCHL